jgi:hypothetical protein
MFTNKLLMVVSSGSPMKMSWVQRLLTCSLECDVCCVGWGAIEHEGHPGSQRLSALRGETEGKLQGNNAHIGAYTDMCTLISMYADHS